jgi:probable HAF family extracellular repeat protein
VGASSTGHLGLATHAFLFTGGVLVDLGTLGEATLFSSATGLNTTTIVGSCSTPENVTVPCVWPRSGGPPQELPTLGGTTPAFLGGIVAINSQGAMVGTSQTPAGDLHATLWPADGSAPVDLTPGTGFDSQALSINEAGVIVGDSQQRAFRWAWSGTSYTVTDLGRFDGDQATSLRGVNDGGLSVGVSELASPSAFAPHRAIRVRGTTLEDLATLVDLPPGWALDTATAVSNSGVIAGDGFLNGEPHGWLLVPTKAAKQN